MRLLIWMNVPSHHQSAFFAALRQNGVDLVVHYQRLSPEPRYQQLGFSSLEALPRGECQAEHAVQSLAKCSDWDQRTHILPGWGKQGLRELASHLSKLRVSWIHWSEPSRPGWRWIMSYPIKRWYARLVNQYALGALAIGEMAQRDFEHWGIEAQRIAFLPYAVEGLSCNARCDEQVFSFSESKLTFMYLGGLEHRKGTDLLIDAFAQVATLYDDVCLVMVGADVGKRDYRHQARMLGLDDKILFRGSIPSDSVDSVLVCADVFILPSRFDGWGVALAEAASLGKALISTNRCGSAYHLIVNGENGFRVPAGDSNSLADKMMIYCRQKDLAEAHGERSMQIFQEYTPERNAQRFLRIVEHWTSQPRRSPLFQP